MSFTPISIVLTEPNSGQPETFNDDANEFASQLNPFAAQLNIAGGQINTIGAQVDADKITTGGYVTAASNSAAAAASSQALAAASADFKGAWSSLTGALNKPASVLHNGSFWALLNNLANVTTSTPSLTNTDWKFISGTQWQATKTASFTVPVNTMQSILATGSTVNATLTASVPDGSFFVIANSAASTQTVMIMNAGYTIRNNRRTITSADNIILSAGQTAYLRAISTTILEVVING